MTLNFYIARKFLWAFLMVLGGFSALMVLIGLVSELHRNASASIGFAQAAGLAALGMPDGVYRILPLVTILAAIMLFLSLARTSELVVIRAAGRSILRTLLAPIVTALVIGAAGVAVLNPIVAATSNAYTRLENHFASSGGNVLSLTREGLWLRQSGPAGQTVIRAQHASLDGTHLSTATFITFGPDGMPLTRIEGATADLTQGGWVVHNAKIWQFAGVANPELSAVRQAEVTVPSDLTQAQIRDSFGNPGQVPIWQLHAFIDRLMQAGFSAREYRVHLQTELAMPLLLVAMVLVAAGFTMRHVRFGHTGVMVLAAVIAGFAIFFLRNFAEALGNSGQIPVALAAWGPPLVAILFSLGLLLHLEDG
ncbi:MAG: LPS export ABC transporter permease LptG [Paracoccaceae bacterium]|nr:LPS export ABC transporter permease LptG [Paracoccaceae bacterium]